jgi:PAS domain S-box-containing protein
MSRALRLLLVEDSEDDAALLARELRRAGYDLTLQRVDTRADLEQALHAPWDVIVSDYRMPTLDAPAAIALVRSRDLNTPCIIVSGTVGEEHAVVAMRSGAQDFVLKTNLSRLVPAIERELRDSEVRIKHARAEGTLRATEASFRAAFELIPDGILVHRKGLVVHANGSAAALLGASDPEDLVGRVLVDLFVPSDQQTIRDRMQESMTPAPLAEVTMIGLDGRVVHVETSSMFVLFDGEPAFLNVVRDVSARRELVARTIHIDRMLAVGTLAAGVGHEINNPLAYVMANVDHACSEVKRLQQHLQALSQRAPAAGTVAAALLDVAAVLEEASEGTRRIRDIARDLNTFARNDDEQLELVDMRAAAESALRMAAAEIRHRARVVRHYEEVPPVRASASRVSQVLLNLVINAAHAIEKGAPDANEISVHIRHEGDAVVVEVRDTGCGIAPQHRERLFTPFFTTKPAGQGTGLGLSISRRIVRSIGGDIAVDSVLGQGTIVRVTIPAVGDSTAQKPSPSPARVRGARLLFVGDDAHVGSALQRALSREHEVVVVDTLQEGLSRVAADPSFDLVLCDLDTVTATGPNLLETLERSLPRNSTRIVLIKGGERGQPAWQSTASRNIPILEKPLDMDQVRALIASVPSLANGT